MVEPQLTTVVATSSRSDFGLVRPIIRYMFREHADVVLLCVGRATLLEDGYLREGIGELEIVRLGGQENVEHLTSAHETVLSLSQITAAVSEWLAGVSPDWFIVPGDRFEIFAAAIAAFYNNVPVAHLFAGDRSEGGHQDDSVRHAISKIAHQHFAVSDDSYQRILRLGEEPWRVHQVGSPVVESVLEVVADAGFDLASVIEPRTYNIVCTYHPITTEPERAGVQFQSLVDGLNLLQQRLDVAVIVTPPNNENGSEAIRRLMEEQRGRPGWYVVPDLGWQRYLQVLSKCDLVVGNSSSAMLEAPIVHVPAVDVGTRQRGRFAPPTVERVEQYDGPLIAEAMERALRGGRTTLPHPYGDGTASRNITQTLQSIANSRSRREILQKRITY